MVAVRMIFIPMSMPNHMMNSGASATLGRLFTAMRMGSSSLASPSLRPSSRPAMMPATAPDTNPPKRFDNRDPRRERSRRPLVTSSVNFCRHHGRRG